MKTYPTLRNRQAGRVVAVFAAVSLVFLSASPADAQIKRPGSHIKYGVEIEPHLVYQWAHESGLDEGFGLGFRASVPIIEDGPIKKINDSMAISFGIDWTRFEDPCGSYWWRGPRPAPNDRDYYYWNEDCKATQLWFPVVLQWNFWLTETISVFGEPGLAFQHVRWNYYFPCNSPDGWCEEDDTDTDLEPVFWGGARFLLSDSIAITLRIGEPSFTAGASFFL